MQAVLCANSEAGLDQPPVKDMHTLMYASAFTEVAAEQYLYAADRQRQIAAPKLDLSTCSVRSNAAHLPPTAAEILREGH